MKPGDLVRIKWEPDLGTALVLEIGAWWGPERPIYLFNNGRVLTRNHTALRVLDVIRAKDS